MLDDVFINNLPTLDLHGETKDSSRFLLKSFIEDNYKLKNHKILVVHGIGKGILKKEVHKNLKLNSYVEDYHVDMFNPGCTIIYLKNEEKR